MLQLSRIAKVIIPRPEEQFFLSRTVQLLAIQSGESKFDELVDTRHCIVLIPCAVYGSPTVTVTEPESPHGKQEITTVTFEVDSIYMIAGRCSISIPDESKLVCVMLCIRRGSR